MNTLSSILKFIANSIAPTISSQAAKKVLAAPNGAAGVPSFRELKASDITSEAFSTDRIPSLDASKITSGTFADARIPNLAASKITSGTLADARIPNLAASKVTSGTFADARIPNLAASKITSGAFSADRIPNISAAKLTSGSFSIDLATTGVVKVDGYKLISISTGLTKTNISLAAGGYNNDVSINVARTGYTPIGVVGWSIANSSSGGVGFHNCSITKAYITGSNLVATVKNHGSSAAKVDLAFHVLYISSGQGI